MGWANKKKKKDKKGRIHPINDSVQLETLFFTNLLQVSIGRDFGLDTPNERLYNWKPFCFTNLLEFSIWRGFGVDTPNSRLLYNLKPFLGTNLLEVSIERDLGGSKGVTSAKYRSVRGSTPLKPQTSPTLTLSEIKPQKGFPVVNRG